jgi:hypothetical protein
LDRRIATGWLTFTMTFPRHLHGKPTFRKIIA